jgi:alpha-glucosidase
VPGLDPGREQSWLWNVDRPEVHDVVRGLRRVADEFGGRILVGELYAPVERIAGYVGGAVDDEFHLAFNFEMLLAAWDHAELTLAIERAEALHPPDAIPTFALSNHDQPRHATRWGRSRAPLAALMLLTLRGVSTLYMGEEIGMIDHPRLPRDRHFDRAGRDGQRTPMQWEPGPGAGFTSGTPWLPTVDADRVNVADQRDREGSLLDLYRRLIALRRRSAALRRGTHRSLFGVAPDVLAWTREAHGDRVAVVCNLANEPRTADLSRVADSGDVLLSTVERGGDVELRRLELAGLEGLIVSVPAAGS